MPSSRLCGQLQTCGVSMCTYKCTYTHAQISLEKRKKAPDAHVQPGLSSKGHIQCTLPTIQAPYHRRAQQGMGKPWEWDPQQPFRWLHLQQAAGRVQLHLHSTAPQVHSTVNTVRAWCPGRLRRRSAFCTPRSQSLGDYAQTEQLA